MINHQVFVAHAGQRRRRCHADRRTATQPVGPGPFDYDFSPDGKHLIVQYFDQQVTWLADPSDGTYDVLPWGNVSDPPSWQRVAPE